MLSFVLNIYIVLLCTHTAVRSYNMLILTFDDLSRSQMTSDPKNSNRFISSLVSAFQKHIG